MTTVNRQSCFTKRVNGDARPIIGERVRSTLTSREGSVIGYCPEQGLRHIDWDGFPPRCRTNTHRDYLVPA